MGDFQVWDLAGSRDQEVHQTGVEELAGLVEGEALVEGAANALGDSTVDLALYDDRIDHHAAIVDDDVAQKLGVAGDRIDLHDDRVLAAVDVFEQKLVRRKVSLKHLEKDDPSPGTGGTSKLLIKIKEGIETDKARQIVKMVKDKKMKVQAAIQEQSVRVTGKKRDDLQEVIKMLKGAEELGLDLQYVNFRD